jgi:hypothetical protein
MLMRCLTLGLAVTFLTVSAADVFAKDKRGGVAAPKANAMSKASANAGANKQRQNLQKKKDLRGVQKAFE